MPWIRTAYVARLGAPLTLALVVVACGPPSERPSATAQSEQEQASGGEDADELPPMLPPLESEDVVVGTGREAQQGDLVAVHYRGALEDGTVFDSSYERGSPLEFAIGDGKVIPGWEIGVAGMKKGGKRKLIIPPHLGYGSAGSPPKIGPDATLHFDVELVDLTAGR